MNGTEEGTIGRVEATDEQSGKGNRPALWALLGVGVGFALPIGACLGLFVVFSIALQLFAGPAGTAGVAPVPMVHVSGPLSGPAVAMIDLEGPIVSGSARPFGNAPMIAADDLIPVIRQADEEEDVKAIVLNVNTPGGAVVPSDRIHHALEEVDKPIVVTMGDVAASGGVYLSMAADYIVANPSTLTGSIGVISQFPNAEELLDKIGVEFAVIKSGESKDIGSPYRQMEAEEREIWQGIVDEAHQRFVQVVSEGRGLPEEEVRTIADGRILSASQALEIGLIDATGYRQDAIDEAASRGGIEGDPRVIRFRRPPALFDLLNSALLSDRLPLLPLPVDLPGGWLVPSLYYRWLAW